MKRLVLILATFLLSKTLLAEHITGGEMYYTFLGMSGTQYQYRVTLKLYRDCNSPGAQLDDSAPIAVYARGNNSRVWSSSVARTRIETLELGSPGPCIVNAPVVCYEVGYYETVITLNGTPAGYVISYQRCCRINGISNLVASGSGGATYTAIIPGTNQGSSAPENNSAKFRGVDTVIVCGGYPFTYSFAATDLDGDTLRYSFCNAYSGGGPSQGTGPNNSTPDPPAQPPYASVSYGFPYSGQKPLGEGVTISPFTGLIQGTSPPQGIYVVTVCVSEIRGGVVIATQRKDLQIKAGGCDIAKPVLKPEYITCDGLTFNFTQPTNSLITSYYWEFGDPASGAVNNTSALQNPTHVYSAPGQYTMKLVANRGQECSDSATAIVKVWPGFFPAFTSAGICLLNPVNFTDQTTTNFGFVDKWSWDFGDGGTADTSDQRNPSYTFSSPGTKNVQLIVGSNLGCIDTLIQPLNIIDKPPITLPFRDTLICVPDALQLQASGSGVFSWSPGVNIINANSPTPTVNPTSTQLYYVDLNEQGCINRDSVLVRVVDYVSINIMPDTTICLTDPVLINVNSDGLKYLWTPSITLDDATLQDPTATPVATSTVYSVLARIGSCTATRDITITTVPYPIANAGLDTTICYNSQAMLHGSHDGSSFVWSPTNTLTNANTLNPIAFPIKTSPYVLSAYDTRGCPKPGRDTVLVNVMPKVNAYAGNDTLVVVGQPLQLNAEGGVRYFWSPAVGLNDPNIKNPIASYDSEIDSIRYTVFVYDTLGCVDSAFKNVVVFKTNPYVFVPSGFTPNGDGRNDAVRPIAVGVARIEYFQVYNRWGQMVFSTTINGYGWDGRIGGVLQGTNVFVWMVKAIDYLGRPIFLKGTTTLIR